MQDLTLDFENKIIKNTFLTRKELIIQNVILALQCWTGDWFLNGEYGIPYNLRMQNKSLLIADIQEVILSIDGVLSVENIKINIKYGDVTHKRQKYFDISATIITDQEEQVEMNGLVPIIGK